MRAGHVVTLEMLRTCESSAIIPALTAQRMSLFWGMMWCMPKREEEAVGAKSVMLFLSYRGIDIL